VDLSEYYPKRKIFILHRWQTRQKMNRSMMKTAKFLFNYIHGCFKDVLLYYFFDSTIQICDSSCFYSANYRYYSRMIKFKADIWFPYLNPLSAASRFSAKLHFVLNIIDDLIITVYHMIKTSRSIWVDPTIRRQLNLEITCHSLITLSHVWSISLLYFFMLIALA
jgi:hypothetical protein